MRKLACRPAWGYAAAAVLLAVFIAIASAISAGLTHGFDSWGLLAFRDAAQPLRPVGPAWLEETARDFSGLGSNGVMTALVGAGAGLLASARRRPAAVFLLCSFCGALALDTAVKHWFARPRPDLVAPAARVFTFSFPSGHATVSSAALLAASLLLLQAGKSNGFRAVTAAAALFLLLMIGGSRLCLGVHWPTDVLGGWALGLSWTALCWAMRR